MNTTEAVAMVPLSELIVLALTVRQMRRAQMNYFEQRRKHPTKPLDDELREARDHERRVDRLVREVITREQPALPGMDPG